MTSFNARSVLRDTCDVVDELRCLIITAEDTINSYDDDDCAKYDRVFNTTVDIFNEAKDAYEKLSASSILLGNEVRYSEEYESGWDAGINNDTPCHELTPGELEGYNDGQARRHRLAAKSPCVTGVFTR